MFQCQQKGTTHNDHVEVFTQLVGHSQFQHLLVRHSVEAVAFLPRGVGGIGGGRLRRRGCRGRALGHLTLTTSTAAWTTADIQQAAATAAAV